MASAPEQQRAPPRPPPPQTSQSTSQSRLIGPNSVADIKTFTDFVHLKDAVYRCVELALQADEQEDGCVALENYLEGQRLLEIALWVNCETLQSRHEHAEEAKTMQQKMNKTRQQVTFRLQDLQRETIHTADQQVNPDEPPSYEEAINEAPGSMNSLDEEMMRLGDSIFSENGQTERVREGTDVFSIPCDVQIFYITPEGLVSAPSYPTSLNIVKFTETSATHAQAPPAFLHVGDWIYPLIPGTSPALRTIYGGYIFPDVMSQQTGTDTQWTRHNPLQQPGSAVGLILPEGLPDLERQKFEQLIQEFTAMEQQRVPVTQQPQAQTSQARSAENQPEEVQDTSSKISQGILTAAEWISWGVGKGAEKAGELIQVGAKKIKEKTNPATSERPVDPRIQKGVVYARQATNAGVKVTGYIVNKLGEATMALARQVAPHVRKKGEKYIPKSLSEQGAEGGKSKLDSIVEVAASGLQGFGTVYIGLETAAKILGKNLADETVQVVHHKYGSQMGNVTENGMYAAGNAVMTAYNANHIGVKAVAKRAAKDTGKAVIEDLNKSKGQNPTHKTDQGQQTPPHRSDPGAGPGGSKQIS